MNSVQLFFIILLMLARHAFVFGFVCLSWVTMQLLREAVQFARRAQRLAKNGYVRNLLRAFMEPVLK